MMKVFLDEQPVSDAGQSLTSALNAVREQAGARLVIEAHADGSPVPSAHLSDPPATEPYAGELRFTSADAVALVRESLLEAADLLEPIREEHQRLADQIASADTEAALQRLAPVLAIWQKVMATLQAVRACDAITIVNDGEAPHDVDAAATRLNDRLVDLRNAISIQDWSAISDILCFDLVEQVDQWRSLLVALARAVQPAPAQA